MKKKDNIIFLDFDGVINTKDDDFSGEVINHDAVYYVNKLCLENNFKIVVCSSWRHRQDYKDFLHGAGISKEIEILGKTDLSISGREAEIKDYINTHDIGKYLIIDDAYLNPDLKDHHVQPASRIGFTENKYEEALIKISKM